MAQHGMLAQRHRQQGGGGGPLSAMNPYQTSEPAYQTNSSISAPLDHSSTSTASLVPTAGINGMRSQYQTGPQLTHRQADIYEPFQSPPAPPTQPYQPPTNAFNPSSSYTSVVDHSSAPSQLHYPPTMPTTINRRQLASEFNQHPSPSFQTEQFQPQPNYAPQSYSNSYSQQPQDLPQPTQLRTRQTSHLGANAFSLDAVDDSDDTSTGKDKRHHGGVWGGFDSTMRAGTFNLCNVILGSGIIALPAAIEQAGLVAGLLLILFQAFITDYSLRLLITSGLKLKVFDYEELLRAAFGRRGWLVGLISIFLLDFGVMVTFMIIMTDTFSPVLSYYLSSDASPSVFLNRTFTLWFISLCTVLPLSCLKSLKQLGWVSMMSVTTVVGIVLLICWKLAFGASTSSSSASSASAWTFVGSNFFSAFGSISFVFVCHDASFAVFQSISSPTQTKWNRVVRAAVLTGLVPAIILAIVGYFAFVNSSVGIQSNILNNFPASDFLVNIARLAVGASMIMTYPLNLFMCRHVLATLLVPSSSSSSQSLSPGMHLGLTLGLFFSTLLLASMLTNLGVVQSLVGGIAGSMLAFVLPALATLRTRELVSGRMWLHVENAGALGLLGLGVFIMTVATFQALFG